MSARTAGHAGGRLENVAGALLLGGASQRMGRDKSQLSLDGESLAARSAQLLARCFAEVLLVGAAPGAADSLGAHAGPLRFVADPPGPRCPLRGLVGALSAAQAPRVVVIATDLPGLCDALPLALSAWPDADAVVPRRNGGAEPLCALWRRSAVLPLARARLAEGAALEAGAAARALSLRGLIEALGDVRWLEGPDLAALDPGGRAFFNVNTPADWAGWRARRSADRAPREGGDGENKREGRGEDDGGGGDGGGGGGGEGGGGEGKRENDGAGEGEGAV